jgi:Flp pilus assembly protein TadD
MSLALQHLAFLKREAGDASGAVSTLKKALAANPDDVEIATLLGAYLNETGRSKEAASLLQVFAERPNPEIDVLLAQGAALAQSGRAEQAVATFERALSVDPTNAAAKANLGTAYLVKRDYPKAEAALRAALSLDPDVSRAHNALGVIAVETGRPDEAIEHWKRAVELNPREWDTVFNLARLLRQRGRAAEAEPYVQQFVRGAPPAQYADDIRRLRESASR